MGASGCKGTCGIGVTQAGTVDLSSRAGRAPSREPYKVHEGSLRGVDPFGDRCGDVGALLKADRCGAMWGDFCNRKAASAGAVGVGGSSSSSDPHGGVGDTIIGGNLPTAAPVASPLGERCSAPLAVPEVSMRSLANGCNDAASQAALEPPGNGDAAGGVSGGVDYGGPGNPENYWTDYFWREASELKRMQRPAEGMQMKAWRRHVFETGAVYDGQWDGNERSGFGLQMWPDGAEYMGQWHGNTATGRGCFRHCDGDVYSGEWRLNMAHGQGVYHLRDGTTYEGEFVDDMQDGYGVESWPDRSQYVGRFCKGRKSGFGAYVWPDGSQFSGSWFANRIDGYGTYVGADNRRFDGKWKGSAMHGCGRYCWPDGRQYWGQYFADQKDGFGTFTWANGRRYDGYWVAGKQHGVGLLSLKGSVARLGRWSHGERLTWLDEPLEGGDNARA